MDSLTHILVGAATGQVFSTKDDKFKPLIWGAIAGSLPDLDSLFQFFISPVNSMLSHRGLSHSLLLWAICSPLLALLINKIHKGNCQSYFKWLKISSIAWFSHIFLDVFNTYGTGIFEPFSHVRISIDAINVVDFTFLIPLVISFVFFAFVLKKYKAKVVLASLSLLFVLGFISFSMIRKNKTEHLLKTQLVELGISPKRILTTPLPLSNFMWKIVAEDTNGYYSGVYSVIWKNKVNFEYLPKNNDLEQQLAAFDNFRQLKRFTKGWYTLNQKSENEIVLSDLRFSSLDNGKNVLEFLLRQNENSLEVGRTAPKRHITSGNIKNYFKQIVNP